MYAGYIGIWSLDEYNNVYVCSASQSCLLLCHPMNCSLPGSSVHEVFHAAVLEWVTISPPRIFSDQGLNPCLLHWWADSLPLEPPGKPDFIAFLFLTWWKSKILQLSKNFVFVDITVNFHMYGRVLIFSCLIQKFMIAVQSVNNNEILDI